MSTIADGKIVTFHYTLTNAAGDVVDTSLNSGEPLPYLHGGMNIVPGLERELTGKSVGDKLNVTVSPADGYGIRDESMTQEVPRDAFPEDVDIQVGMQFVAQSNQGPVPIWIRAVSEEAVLIDQNHPLAGETLHFDVEIVSIREATDEEITHGHPHGPGGHAH